MMKKKTKICSVVAFILIVLVLFATGSTESPANSEEVKGIQAAEQAIQREYEKWMEEAKIRADTVGGTYVYSYLDRARWCIEDANIPGRAKAAMLKSFFERAEDTLLKGHKNAASYEFTEALNSAYRCSATSTEDHIERYIIYSLKAEMDPDVKKIKEVRAILKKSLAERDELRNAIRERGLLAE